MPVQIKIDNGTYIKTSDEHGSIQLRVPQSAKEITAKVMPDSEVGKFQVDDADHHSIGLFPVNELPTRFRFRFISSPVSTFKKKYGQKRTSLLIVTLD